MARVSTDLTGLQSGTSYDASVTARGDGETWADSDSSDIVTFNTLSKLSTPTGFEIDSTNDVENKTDTSITFRWEEIDSHQRYIIEYQETGQAAQSVEFDVYQTKTINSKLYGYYELTSLLPGTTYSARIKRLAPTDDFEDSDYSESTSAKTKRPIPVAAPSNFDMRTGKLIVRWNEHINAVSYVCVAYLNGSEAETISVSGSPAEFTRLNEGSTYTFGLKAFASPSDNEFCDSSEAISGPVSYNVSSLPAPETFRVTETTDTTITLEWTAVSGATGYELQFRKVGGSYQPLVNFIESDSIYTRTVINLDPNTEYEFQLIALGDGDTIQNSVPTTITSRTERKPMTQLLSPVDFGVQLKDENGLDADYLSYNFVRLMWSPIDNAVGYRIRYRKSTESEWQSLTNFSVYASGYNIDKCYIEIHSLESLTNYTFDIISIGDNVDYINSTETTITATTDRAPAVPLAAPQNFVISGTTATAIELSWSSVAHASGYRVRYKKSADQAWESTTDFTSSNGVCQTSISPLDSDTEYTFELTAVGDSLDYTDSESVTIMGVTAEAPKKLAAPEIFRTKSVTDSKAVIEWSSVDGATGYRLRYRKGNGSWLSITKNNQPGTTADWENELAGLSANSGYECELTILGDGVNNLDSDPQILSFTTLVSGELEPTTLSAVIVNGGFYCQWEPVDGANSYVLAYFDTQNDESSIVESIRINGSETYWQTNILTSDPDGQGYLAIYPSVLPTNGTGNERKPWSNFVQVRDVGSVYELLPPRNVNVVGTTMSVISLEWEPVLAATSYVVKCGTKEVVTQSAFADITGLLADTDYEIQVKSRSTYSFFARNESDYGAPITARTAQRVLEKLEAPNIRLVSKTDSTITVNWEFVEHASGYKLFYNVAGSGNPATKIESYETVGNKAQVTITGLSAATNYIIEALAVGDAYDYQDSDRSRLPVKTDSAPLIPLDTPSGLVCVDKTKDTISLEWNGVANASGYIVSYGSRTISVTNPAAVLPNLAHGRTYSIKVKAVGDGSVYGDSPYTAAIRVETDSDPIPEGERKTALNYIRTGRLVSIKPTEVIPKGTAIKQGAVVGVINHTRFDEDKFGSLELDGIYNVPLASGASFALGDLVCLDEDGNAAASGMKFGYAIEATNSKSRRVKTLLVPWLDTLK